MWPAIIAAGLGCWALKLSGMSLPARVLERPFVGRVANLIPVSLLAALIVVQVFTGGPGLVLDARALALAYAAIALSLRAPFLVVVFGAAGVAAVARLIG